MSVTDSNGVTRWRSVLELPDRALQCLAFGHAWDPGPVVESRTSGARTWRCKATCGCSRTRTDTLAPSTGELIGRAYYGGHGFLPGAQVDRSEARAEWFRRQRSRARAVDQPAAVG